MAKQKILITNDDGINAPGIAELTQALSSDYDVTVVAPSRERSGASSSVNFSKKLILKRKEGFFGVEAYTVSGSPTDCSRSAFGVLKKSFDLVVSGINHGSNAGRTILFSGTCGGVIDGVLRGVPGIAFSYTLETKKNLPNVREYVRNIVKAALHHGIEYGSMWNVTFPQHDYYPYKGIRMGHQGKGYWIEDPITHARSENEIRFTLSGTSAQYTEDPYSDVSLLKEGFITIVPAQVSELTAKKYLDEKQHLVELMLNKEMAPL